MIIVAVVKCCTRRLQLPKRVDTARSGQLNELQELHCRRQQQQQQHREETRIDKSSPLISWLLISVHPTTVG